MGNPSNKLIVKKMYSGTYKVVGTEYQITKVTNKEWFILTDDDNWVWTSSTLSQAKKDLAHYLTYGAF